MKNTEHNVPADVRVDLRRDAWGVPGGDVRLSWRLPASWAGTGLMQAAYRVRVTAGTYASAPVVFDSGRREDGSYLSRPLGCDGLTPGGLYAVSVCVYAQDGTESGPSEPCAFSVWEDVSSLPAVWPVGEAGGVPALGFVRQSFTLTEDECARLDRVLVTAAGRSPEAGRQYVYTLFLNGVPLGVGATREGRTPDSRPVIYAQTFDAAGVCAGENVLGAYVTDPGEGRMFLCTARAYFRDGTSRVLTAPDGWMGLDGTSALRPSNSLGTHYFKAFASNIDAAVYPFGYDAPGFDASGWAPCLLRGEITAPAAGGDAYVLVPSTGDPVGRYPLPDAPSVVCLGEGHYAVDLGREIIGSIRLRVPGGWTGEADVTVYFGEQLRAGAAEDGTVVKWAMNTSNRYAESWRLIPGVTTETCDMIAFRFVELTGLPFMLTPDMICGVAIRRARADGEAGFTSDVPLLNRMYALTRYTAEATTQDIYVDSQSRERGAYEGDVLINQAAAYAVEYAPAACRFSLEYLYTHRTWPAEYILLICEAAWEDYMETGDEVSLRAYWDVLKDKHFARFLDPSLGLLHSGNAGNHGTDAILVDWPGSERDGYDMTVRYNTVLNCVAAVGFRALSRIAGVLGEADAQALYAGYAETIREAVLTRLYDPSTGDVYDGLSADGVRSGHVSQHAIAYALYAGLYRSQADADLMASRLWERCGGKIRMSVYGAFFLLLGLYESGHGDMANRLLLDPADTVGERTWAYMLNRAVGEGVGLVFGDPVPGEAPGCRALGATITTEAWNTVNKPNMTYSHPWGAAPAAALVRGVFGIRPTAPGFRRFTVRPQLPASLTTASLTLPTASGPIRLSLTAGKLTVEAPAGTERDE